MRDPRDIQVQFYIAARLAGMKPATRIARVLRAVLDRNFVLAEPPQKSIDRIRARDALRQAGTRLSPEAGQDFGYSAEEQCLWILRDALPDFRDMADWKPATVQMLFDSERALMRRLRAFLSDHKRCSDWASGKLSVGTALGSDERAFLESLSVGRPAAASYQGTPWVRTSGGFVRIGLGSAIGRLLPSEQIDAVSNVKVIAPEDRQRLDAALLPSWTTATRDGLRAHVKSLVIAAAPDIAVTLAAAPRFPVASDYEKLPECSRLVYALARNVDGWLQERLVHDAPFRSAHGIFRSIGWYGAQEHHAWIDTFVGRATAAVMRAYDSQVFPITRSHRELRQPMLEFANLTTVVGRPGSGKTTALYHLACRHKGGVIVIGARTTAQRTILATEEEIEIIRRMVTSVNVGWLIIMEGAELEAGQPPATTTLAKLLDIARRANEAASEARVRVMIARSKTPGPDWMGTYKHLGSRYMDLDVLDASLIRTLLATWINLYQVQIGTEQLEQLRVAFSAAEPGRNIRNTPADMSAWTVGEIVERLRRVSDKTITGHDVERLVAR